MGKLVEGSVIYMDGGSAHVVANQIREQISCGEQLAAELDPSNPSAVLFPSISPWVIMCRELAKTVGDEEGEVKPHQCVVLTGNVKACPFLKRCDVTKKLKGIRQEVEEVLTYSPVGNYHTVYGSKWDNS